ncbi:hypothetical protein Hanom_Chr12g01090841 [Helianthus anomalus]
MVVDMAISIVWLRPTNGMFGIKFIKDIKKKCLNVVVNVWENENYHYQYKDLGRKQAQRFESYL